MSYKSVCFCGGGSGGHVYPAKPLIDKLLLSMDAESISWLGSQEGIEKNIVEQWGIPYYSIPSGKLRRYFSFRNITDIFRIISGFFKARRILKKISPDFLFSKGGFVSVPPVYAAHSLGIPVFSHDSDMDPGLATRLNARCSRKIFIPYSQSLKYYPKWISKVIVSGNPVREEFFKASIEDAKNYLHYSGEKPLLLVIGGSLGAQEINEMVKAHLEELCRHFFVVHQTGFNHENQENLENYRSFPFIKEELPGIMRLASLALSRAGAGGIWELAATETPMLLWPLTTGSRGDQPKNARLFQDLGFATLLETENLTADKLLDMLKLCAPGNPYGDKMIDQMKKNPLPDAAEIILRVMMEELQC